MRIQVVLMYKSGDEANEKALEAMLYAEMAVQEIAEMGGTVIACFLEEACACSCVNVRWTLSVHRHAFHSCSLLTMRACTSLEVRAGKNHTKR